jgi:hypothetical protein
MMKMRIMVPIQISIVLDVNCLRVKSVAKNKEIFQGVNHGSKQKQNSAPSC